MNTIVVFDSLNKLQTWVTEYVMYAPNAKWKARGKRPTELHMAGDIYHLYIIGEPLEPYYGMNIERAMYYCKEPREWQKELERKRLIGSKRLTLVSEQALDN